MLYSWFFIRIIQRIFPVPEMPEMNSWHSCIHPNSKMYRHKIHSSTEQWAMSTNISNINSFNNSSAPNQTQSQQYYPLIRLRALINNKIGSTVPSLHILMDYEWERKNIEDTQYKAKSSLAARPEKMMNWLGYWKWLIIFLQSTTAAEKKQPAKDEQKNFIEVCVHRWKAAKHRAVIRVRLCYKFNETKMTIQMQYTFFRVVFFSCVLQL